MDNMIREDEQVKWVIKVNGVAVSVPFSDKGVAAQNIANLPVEQQMIAEVVAVTAGGQQILFG